MKNNDMKKIKHIAFGLTTMAVLLLSGCTKDEAPDGADTGNKISAINVTAGGFTAAAGSRSVADSDDTQVAVEDAGTIYTREAIGTGANDSGAQTRATDDGYIMTFDAGDKIGLTVVKSDETIVHNNLVLTYNDATGWGLPTGAEIWYDAAVEYIAYYPYAAAMTAVIGDATTKTGEGIEAAIFAAFEPKTDQSDYKNYTASDLMLWSGVANTSGITPKLDIALKHAMALVIVEPKGAGYKAPAGADWIYYEGAGYSAPTDVAVTIDGTPYTPYAMLESGNSTAPGAIPGDADGTYRVLVKPSTDTPPAAAISGAYETMGVPVAWDNSAATNKDLEAATYLKYNIAPPAAVGIRAPQVGDYFYLADGVTYTENRILPSGLMTEGTKPATDAERNRMGVIYWLDPADATKGKIVSLDEGTSEEWGPYGYTANAISTMDGLSNMAAVKAYIGSNSNSHIWTYFPAFEWVDLKNGGAGTTDYAGGATGIWYLPAKEELKALYAGFSCRVYEEITGWNDTYFMPEYNTDEAQAARAAFNNILMASGGAIIVTSLTYYWSSTEISDSRACHIYFATGAATESSKLSQNRVRAIMAF